MMKRRTRGQAMAEFALVAPFFILAMLAAIEFGRAVFTIQVLNNAAREGARYAIVHGASSGCPSGPMPLSYGPNPCDPSGARVIQAVQDNAIGVLKAAPTDLTVTVKWCQATAPVNSCPPAPGDGTNDRGENVVVDVTYSYRTLVPLVPMGAFTVSGGSTLVVNH